LSESNNSIIVSLTRPKHISVLIASQVMLIVRAGRIIEAIDKCVSPSSVAQWQTDYQVQLLSRIEMLHKCSPFLSDGVPHMTRGERL
jgi:hypothetical protein